MRNLIKADLCRILKTKMIYIGTVIAVTLFVWGVRTRLTSIGPNATVYTRGVMESFEGFLLLLVVTVPIFSAVFSHELTAKSMQCILGRGLTRGKLIASKLLDVAILVFGVFLIITAVAFLMASPEYAISTRQMTNSIIGIWLAALRYFGYICFSAMLMFITNSSAFGVIACVGFSLIFKLLCMAVTRIGGIEFYDYTYDGLLDWTYRSLEAGGIGIQVIPALLYLIAALAITIFFFKRKEFEF